MKQCIIGRIERKGVRQAGPRARGEAARQRLKALAPPNQSGSLKSPFRTIYKNKAGTGAGQAMARPKTNRSGPAGSIARAGGKDGPQTVHSKGKRWTDAAEALFFDALAASCNVTWAAAQCGFSTEALYARRRRDPAFAAHWQEALVQGWFRLEAGLVAAAIATIEGRTPDPNFPIPPMSVADVIAVLKLHRAAVHGEGRSPGWRGRPRRLAEVRQSILAKLSAFDRARGKG